MFPLGGGWHIPNICRESDGIARSLASLRRRQQQQQHPPAGPHTTTVLIPAGIQKRQKLSGADSLNVEAYPCQHSKSVHSGPGE